MKLNLTISIDLGDFEEAIDQASTLDNNPLFSRLSQIGVAKNQLNEALEKVESLERDAKGLINARAKAIYGNEWVVIKGDNYKILRSFTGSVYEIDGKPKSNFVVIRKTVDSKAVKEYAETHDGKLPAGIVVNGSRSESLRITVKDNEKDS